CATARCSRPRRPATGGSHAGRARPAPGTSRATTDPRTRTGESGSRAALSGSRTGDARPDRADAEPARARYPGSGDARSAFADLKRDRCGVGARLTHALAALRAQLPLTTDCITRQAVVPSAERVEVGRVVSDGSPDRFSAAL